VNKEYLAGVFTGSIAHGGLVRVFKIRTRLKEREAERTECPDKSWRRSKETLLLRLL
jgi:hypothetical protein